MNDVLLFILSIVGLLALYWALIGQWRWNKKIRESPHDEPILHKQENAKKKE